MLYSHFQPSMSFSTMTYTRLPVSSFAKASLHQPLWKATARCPGRAGHDASTISKRYHYGTV